MGWARLGTLVVALAVTGLCAVALPAQAADGGSCNNYGTQVLVGSYSCTTTTQTCVQAGSGAGAGAGAGGPGKNGAGAEASAGTSCTNSHNETAGPAHNLGPGARPLAY